MSVREEDSSKVQDIFVGWFQKAYTKMVLGSAHSDHTILEPARSLLQAVR